MALRLQKADSEGRSGRHGQCLRQKQGAGRDVASRLRNGLGKLPGAAGQQLICGWLHAPSSSDTGPSCLKYDVFPDRVSLAGAASGRHSRRPSASNDKRRQSHGWQPVGFPPEEPTGCHPGLALGFRCRPANRLRTPARPAAHDDATRSNAQRGRGSASRLLLGATARHPLLAGPGGRLLQYKSLTAHGMTVRMSRTASNRRALRDESFDGQSARRPAFGQSIYRPARRRAYSRRVAWFGAPGGPGPPVGRRVYPGRADRSGPAAARRFAENGQVLVRAYRTIAQATRRHEAITPDTEWLLDNFYIVEDVLREVKHDLPRGYYTKLPRLAARPLAGYPRLRPGPGPGRPHRQQPR